MKHNIIDHTILSEIGAIILTIIFCFEAASIRTFA